MKLHSIALLVMVVGLLAFSFRPIAVAFQPLPDGEGLLQQIAYLRSQTLPVGSIILWWGSGDVSELPRGFEICDGATVVAEESKLAGRPKPDLRGRFPRGQSDSSDVSKLQAVGQGGRDLSWEDGAGNTLGHALSPSQLPPHSHPIPMQSSANEVPGQGIIMSATRRNAFVDRLIVTGGGKESGLAGDGGEHSHPLPESLRDNRPRFTSVHYLIKVY